MKTIEAVFEGRVQGVGFRYACKDLARSFDVSGYVKNLSNGAVRLILQGDQEEVDAYLEELLNEHPLGDHIKSHQISPHPEDADLLGFSIHR